MFCILCSLASINFSLGNTVTGGVLLIVAVANLIAKSYLKTQGEE